MIWSELCRFFSSAILFIVCHSFLLCILVGQVMYSHTTLIKVSIQGYCGESYKDKISGYDGRWQRPIDRKKMAHGLLGGAQRDNSWETQRDKSSFVQFPLQILNSNGDVAPEFRYRGHWRNRGRECCCSQISSKYHLCLFHFSFDEGSLQNKLAKLRKNYIRDVGSTANFADVSGFCCF